MNFPTKKPPPGKGAALERRRFEQPSSFTTAPLESQAARRRILVTRLHRLGPAPLGHFISDIERGAPVAPTLERYAALPAEFVLAYGGDRFPDPLLVVEGGRRP